MFTTEQEISNRTGVFVDTQRVMNAQMMVETFIGRVEEDVTDASDRAILATAVTFQAIYLGDNEDMAWEQIAAKQIGQNESVMTFDPTMFAPFMSPWAVKACSRLSWMRSRSISTGPVFSGQRTGWAERWVTE